MADGSEPTPPPRLLTSTQVAEILGKRRRQDVNEIPVDQLPYSTTRGGGERGGRRYYRPEDVEAYLRRADRLAAVEADLASVRSDVDELKAWRAEHDR